MCQMRRFSQELTPEECRRVLERGTHGVWWCWGMSYPCYSSPLSYVHGEGKLWFHCAKTGHKLDAIRAYPKVSFCVVDRDEIVPEEYTTYFRSVIAFGTARELEDPWGKSVRPWRLGRQILPGAGGRTERGDPRPVCQRDHGGAHRGAHDGQGGHRAGAEEKFFHFVTWSQYTHEKWGIIPTEPKEPPRRPEV